MGAIGTGEDLISGGEGSSIASAVESAETGTCTGTETCYSRSEQVWAPRSLHSLDGCAGEFYEYLDHTADVQLHAWGETLVHAFESVVPCMFNYMTDLSTVVVDVDKMVQFTVSGEHEYDYYLFITIAFWLNSIVIGHDLDSLLYAYLDEFLFRFSTDGFCCKDAKVLQLDRERFSITVQGNGETYDLSRHPQGTEIKAITYSNMQIHERQDKSEIYVIVDI